MCIHTHTSILFSPFFRIKSCSLLVSNLRVTLPNFFFHPGSISLIDFPVAFQVKVIFCNNSLTQWSTTCESWTLWQTPISKIIYIMIHHRSKLQLWSRNENNFMLGWGVTTTWGTVLKDHSIRKVEDHCSDGTYSGIQGWCPCIHVTTCQKSRAYSVKSPVNWHSIAQAAENHEWCCHNSNRHDLLRSMKEPKSFRFKRIKPAPEHSSSFPYTEKKFWIPLQPCQSA